MDAAGPPQAQSAIAHYYRFHARIYDLTRWTFLRGRADLVRRAAAGRRPRAILEVGCGTGKNLLQLGRLFPEARLTGLDLSPHMLARARAKLKGLGARLSLVEAPYDRPVAPGAFDLVVFSYALSMFNPGWEAALHAARRDLAPEGAIAVVDFHASPWPRFRRWMGFNHVRLDAHLLPALRRLFPRGEFSAPPAFGGLWSYFLFIGRRG
jgi:S-adenosylmethionine-diacylgycerolhomoserine-N-methlytransferase